MRSVTEAQLADVTRRLVEALHPQRVILFGSHAYGQPHRDSDLDILVIVAHSDQSPYDRDAQAYRALRGVGVPVEVQVYTEPEFRQRLMVPLSLERTVQERGRVLYAA